MRNWPRAFNISTTLIAAVLATSFASACGDEGETRTVTVEREVPADPAPVKPKKQRPRRERDDATRFVACDSNIDAKADTTTCPFAQNVFWTYWTSGESTGPLEVWSPAVQASFATSCRRGSGQVKCTTTDDAVVRFPQAAVDAYSQDQADAYASGHDLGPDPYEGLPAPDPEEGGGEAVPENCQGYEPCLTPGDDVDCAAGSGDGPRYVNGPVSVSGSDPYDLDRDGDGIACEA